VVLTAVPPIFLGVDVEQTCFVFSINNWHRHFGAILMRTFFSVFAKVNVALQLMV